MEFHQHADTYSAFRKVSGMSVSEFHDYFRERANEIGDPFGYRHSLLEEDWINHRRPYYNVWPAVVPMAERLRLDIPSEAMPTRKETLCLKLPVKNNPLSWDCGEIKAILYSEQEVAEGVGSLNLVRGIGVMLNTGEMGDVNNPIHTFKFFPLLDGKTVEESAELLPEHYSINVGLKVPHDVVVMAIKLCCCVNLIGNNPDFITPDIIRSDIDKYKKGDAATKERLIEKAKKRGKNGHHFGAELETIPHYRRPHLAVVWTGKGRTTPKVVMRKGAVVQRTKLTDVPTGHDG